MEKKLKTRGMRRPAGFPPPVPSIMTVGKEDEQFRYVSSDALTIWRRYWREKYTGPKMYARRIKRLKRRAEQRDTVHDTDAQDALYRYGPQPDPDHSNASPDALSKDG